MSLRAVRPTMGDAVPVDRVSYLRPGELPFEAVARETVPKRVRRGGKPRILDYEAMFVLLREGEAVRIPCEDVARVKRVQMAVRTYSIKHPEEREGRKLITRAKGTVLFVLLEER